MATPVPPSRPGQVSMPSTLSNGCAASSKYQYEPGMLRDVTSLSDFARILDVPTPAISLIVLKQNASTKQYVICKNDGCSFYAVEGNGNRCPIHQRSWYPRDGRRGCDMYGPEFLRSDAKKYRGCDCDVVACKTAGYFPKQPAIHIPKEGRSVVLGTPNLFSEKFKRKWEEATPDKQAIYLNPWHFFREHLQKEKDGPYKLDYDKKSPQMYRDFTGNKSYPFPPHRKSVKLFIEEEFLADSRVRPQDRWQAGSNEIPKWLKRMIDIDSDNAKANEIAPVPVAEVVTPASASEIMMSPPLQRRVLRSHTQNNAQTPTQTKQYGHVLETPQDAHTPSVSNAQDVDHWRALAEKYAKNSRDLTRERNEALNRANEMELRARSIGKEKKEIEERHKQQLAGTKRKYDVLLEDAKKEIAAVQKAKEELEIRVKELEEKIKDMHALLEDCKELKGRSLRYDDLYEGGVLSKHVDAFTFFKTVKANDAFLQLLNYADGSPGSMPEGDGLLENLRPYSKVKRLSSF